MLGIAAVTALPLDALGTAAATMDSSARGFLDAAITVHRSADALTDWHGSTREAVAARLDRQSCTANGIFASLDAAAGLGREACATLGPARTLLLQLVGTAAAKGFAVADDGTVTHPSGRRGPDAAFLTFRITSLLAQLTAYDEVLGVRLHERAAQLTLDAIALPSPLGGWADPTNLVRQLTTLDHEEVRRFWAALASEETRLLINTAPEVIGNLYGVAFADRIQANRIGIGRALTEEMQSGRGDGDRARELRSMLDPTRKFLAFSAAGTGSYIEQIGELHPDLHGVGVLVPGTGTNLNNAGDQRRRAAALAERSGSTVFVFSDGTLPQRVIPEQQQLRSPSAYAGTAVDGEPARTLGRRLVAFGRDLDAEIARHAPGTATTYLGHSYGGSVVGTAEQYGLRADRIVFASSAGTGAADGPWRDPNPAVQRYSLTPPGDPIHWAQKYGGSVHGGDPDSTPGVQRLDSGWYSQRGATPGGLIEGWGAHGAYLDDPDSTAFTNLADVIAGRSPTHYVARRPDIPQQAAEGVFDAWLRSLTAPFAGLR